MRGRIFLGKGLIPLLLSSLIILFLTGCAEDSNILDNGKSRQLEFSVMTHGWNSSNSSSSSSKSNSRATPISGNTFDTSKSFNLIADQNDGSGNYSTFIDKEPVSYSNNIWKITKDYYWSGNSSKTINFYAYYPTSISSNISHTAGSAPTLSYTVPDNVTNQSDIIVASKENVAGNTTASTNLIFKHIFAVVQFSVGSNGMPSGTITGVTLNNIQYKGTYSLDGTWTPNTTDKKSFSQTVSVPTSAGTVITSGTTTFIMMPQTLGSDASITVTYSNGGTLTKAITGTWEAGKVYTYNLSKTIPVANFDYTGDVQTYTVPLTGTYKLEVWGAQGGEVYEGGVGGYGGYSYGNIMLKGGDILYICVGGSGASGGYNGGGKGDVQGGGASHIAIINRGMLDEYISHQEEVVIAAGGGGSGERSTGGSGGGISGESSTTSSYPSGAGGNQTLGGISVAYPDYVNSSTLVNGSFGQGGYGYTPTPNTSQDYGAGGGGGWYGGGGTSYDGAGGGGSGHLGSSLISGTTGMQNGIRSANGFARITFVSAN